MWKRNVQQGIELVPLVLISGLLRTLDDWVEIILVRNDMVVVPILGLLIILMEREGVVYCIL